MGAVLVVDDHPSALAGLAYALRDRWEVILAATVGEALAALRGPLAVVAVVLDLRLREPAAPLHRELLLRETPVVVVSGMEADAARGIAEVWGWPALLKPVADADLLAAVERAARRTDARATDSATDSTISPPAATPETSPMHDTSPQQRATMAPDDPDSSPSPPISRVTGVPMAPTDAPRPAPPELLTPSGAPASPHDPTRDRIRVVADRVLYLAALAAVVVLKVRHELDVETGFLILLVAGIRPHNLFELAQAAKTGGGRAAVAVLAATMGEAIRSGSWLGR